MANVAGVTQLMETVGVPTNQTASPTPTSEHSFATVMRQANTDAGVPVAPAERQAQPKVQAKQNDAGHPAENDEQASAHAAGQGAQSPVPETGKVLAVAATPQPSLRYTSANMLSAMATHAGVGADANTAKTVAISANGARTASPTVAPPSQASPKTATLPAISSASSASSLSAVSPFNNAAPMQVAALDEKPVDLAAPVAAAPAVSSASAKPSAKSEAPASQTAHSVTKQEAVSKGPEPAATPVASLPGLSAPVPVTLATPSPSQVAMDTSTPAVAPAEAIKVATVAKVATDKPSAIDSAAGTKSGTLGQSAAATTAAMATRPFPPATIPSVLAGLPAQTAPGTAQVSGATFRQSLAATQTEPVTATAANLAGTPLASERPLTTAANQKMVLQPGVATSKSSAPAATVPQPSSTTAVPLAAPAPVPVSGSTSAASAGPAQPHSTTALAIPGAVSAPPAPDSSIAHKASEKPSISDSATPQTAPTASQTSSQSTAQPAAFPSAASSDGKEASHNSTAPVAASAPVLPADGSTSVSTAFPVAHTPVAVTALSNSSGPVLATGAATTSVSTTPATDPLQHTTLSSTPTTLEVGVASGTHGWLKIRAELNTSGTVDASLTGANAAAAGKLHNDLPALSSFLQDEKVVLGSLNVAAPSATASALHSAVASALEPTSSFTRSAAESVGATGTAVASDAGAPGGRAPQQQAPESSPAVTVAREDDGVAGAIAAPISAALYGGANDMVGSGALSEGGYGGGGSWLNVRA